MSFFDSLQKPTLLLNETVARENIRRMAFRAQNAQVSFRPHFKTHQSLEIAEWFRAVGVSSITVSSLDMAEYFAGGGWSDILLAFPVNIRQLSGLNSLASRVHLHLLVESSVTVSTLAKHLSNPVDLWLKIDSGTGRTGIRWDDSSAVLRVIDSILPHPNLRLQGLLTHAGAAYTASTPLEAVEIHKTATARLQSLRNSVSGKTVFSLRISVGDTPGCSLLDTFAPADEIRPGNFVFYDAQQLKIGACSWDQIAVALACPVVALHPERSEVVIYGGAIHLSKDYTEVDGVRQYGLVCLPRDDDQWGPPIEGAYVARLSQEHGILHHPINSIHNLKVGDLVCILPAHSCLTAQAMGSYLTLSGRQIEMLRSP